MQKKIEEKEKEKKIPANLVPICNFNNNLKIPKPGNSTKNTYQIPIAINQNKKDIVPYIMIPSKQEKSNLEILFINDESANKVIKIGNLKMLSPWNIFDNKKIIFYKNLNFEYYDPNKNELKGNIYLNQGFTAKKTNNFQFDLVAIEKVYSFNSRKEDEIKEWVEIINKNINEYKKNKLNKSN